MLDFIQNTASPILAAFLLGLLFAFDTCQILTNIAAIGYISRDVTNKRRLFIKCLYFVFGRIAVLGLLSFLLILLLKTGSEIFDFGHFFVHHGKTILIPFLLIFGILFFFSDKISWLKITFSTEKMKNTKNDNFGAFILGAVLSLAFCPTNAMLFFGILIPLAASVSYGYFALPLVFSVTTALPVILIVLIMVFSIKSIDKFYKITDKYSKIAIKITAVFFILAGLFLLAEHFHIHLFHSHCNH